ncbi:hypothetical protein PG995_004248 [Apiospora arundinis]
MDTLTNDDFRVLILLPGAHGTPLRCELLTSSLSDHPPYETVSYVWRVKPDPVDIELDGQPVTISEGLRDILFRLRGADEPRVLWVDRLCINQDNEREKTSQVSQMRAIYSKCTRVLLWMGELEEETQLADAGQAVKVLEFLAAFDPGESDSDSDSDSGSDSGSETSSGSGSGSTSGSGSATSGDNAASEEDATPEEDTIAEDKAASEDDAASDISSGSGKSLTQTIKPPVPECTKSNESFRAAMEALSQIGPVKGVWWHRVWTVQEAMLPPDAAILWGPFSIAWSTLDAMTRSWMQDSYQAAEAFTHEQDCMIDEVGHLGSWVAHIIWIGQDRATGAPPMPTAVKWRSRSATVAVDNVYALTGLHHAGALPRSEKCDYALDVRQVYINYTMDLIHRDEDGGDLLPLVIDPRLEAVEEADVVDGGDGVRGTGTSATALPRWVMDMSKQPKYDTVPWRQFHFYDRWEANRGFPRDHEPNYDGEALCLSGVSLDTIALVGDAHRFADIDADNFPLAQPVLTAWWLLYCRSAHFERPSDDVLLCGLDPGNCAAYEAFCRLVLGDIVGDEAQHWALDDVDLRDCQNVARHMRTGEDLDHLRICVGRAIKNRRHGRVPFTLRPRRRREDEEKDDGAVVVDDADAARESSRGGDDPKTSSGNNDDYDFVGACHVAGIMFGDDALQEAAEQGQRIARLY